MSNAALRDDMDVIHRCALGLIEDRGRKVTAPTMNDLDTEEQDFLTRHVDELRGRWNNEGAVYCTFAYGSPTLPDFQSALECCDEDFLEIAARMAQALCATMTGSPAAHPTCVVALLTSGDTNHNPEHVTFLKLDAKIEAAQLEQAKAQGGIRLRVFKDLLPHPGDLQKGFSWPDPRDPSSHLVFHDTNRGDAAMYFPNAFGLQVSSKATETERALVDELYAQLGSTNARRAVASVDAAGGRADAVVATIREEFPEFQPVTRPLGAGGALPGVIRPHQLGVRPVVLKADGIEVRVPAHMLDAITSEPEGDGWVTIIRTSQPLIDPDDRQN